MQPFLQRALRKILIGAQRVGPGEEAELAEVKANQDSIIHTLHLLAAHTAREIITQQIYVVNANGTKPNKEMMKEQWYQINIVNPKITVSCLTTRVYSLKIPKIGLLIQGPHNK